MQKLCDRMGVQFLSTPSGWRATRTLYWLAILSIFLSTPSGWRATADRLTISAARYEFLSTPSGWRATPQVDFIHKRMSISIHALRVEGDTLFIAFFPSAENFYPRPPGGGRQPWSRIVSPSSKFLSTPSGWRATDYLIHDTETCKFLSTPSGWRATAVCTQNRPALEISIHALRVEGDSCLRNSPQLASCISIHALRVEGDKSRSTAFWRSL